MISKTKQVQQAEKERIAALKNRPKVVKVIKREVDIIQQFRDAIDRDRS